MTKESENLLKRNKTLINILLLNLQVSVDYLMVIKNYLDNDDIELSLDAIPYFIGYLEKEIEKFNKIKNEFNQDKIIELVKNELER